MCGSSPVKSEQDSPSVRLVISDDIRTAWDSEEVSIYDLRLREKPHQHRPAHSQLSSPRVLHACALARRERETFRSQHANFWSDVAHFHDHPGFLLFAMRLMWLVAAAILTMNNLTTVAILAIFSSVGSWRLPSASSISWHSSPEEDSLTQFVVLGTRSTRLCSEKPLDKFGRSPSAETHGRMVFAMEAREGPNTQDGTKHLMAVNIFTSSNSAVGS